MSLLFRSLLLLSLLGLCGPGPCYAESWALPAEVNDTNTTVSFEVDSTFHKVVGTTSGLSGSIVQSDPHDPLSIHVDMSIPVSSFDTDWDARDEKLAAVMGATLFREVRFSSTKLHENCHPIRLRSAGHCAGTLEGTLTIRDVSKQVALPIEIVRHGEKDIISGRLTIDWAEYHVEDPSILIAKLDPSVTILYSTQIPLRKGA